MFIIPMAGLSSRFFKAGYQIPKYQLMLGDETVFSWSVKSFEQYFKTDKFIFIYRDVYSTTDFLISEIEHLGIDDYQLVCLNDETQGQAETVYLGIKDIVDDEEIYIFNIDSKIINFTKPAFLNECDGYLQVFKGNGEHWSFVLAEANSSRVIKTTEKQRISDLCSNGLYYFKSKNVFEQLFLDIKNNALKSCGEYYIAPMYNLLIEQNKKILYDLIDIKEVLFCGTPEEYQFLLSEMNK